MCTMMMNLALPPLQRRNCHDYDTKMEASTEKTKRKSISLVKEHTNS